MTAARRYRVEHTPASARQFRKLPPEVKPRIDKAIAALADDPYPPGVDQDLVLLVKIGHRRDVYRRR